MSTTKVRQMQFFELDHAKAAELPGGIESIAEAFRKLYYHLYTNSESSRAERIISDLSMLLLLKLATEKNGNQKKLLAFLDEKGSADDLLMPILRKTYSGLVDANDRFGMGDNSLRKCFGVLAPISLSKSPAHVLGEAFQALMGPRLRGDKGQFFTPRSLVRAMVEIVAPMPNESVLDPACGTAGFLMESHAYQVQASEGIEPTGRIVGIDKDNDLYRISSALLRIACGENAQLLNLNSLDVLVNNHELVGDGFDVILTNPPFGAKIGVKDKAILKKYDLAHQWIENRDSKGWTKTDIVSSTQDPQILFLEACVRVLKPGGRLGIVLPEGVFGNKRSSFIWDWIRGQGKITALLDCPRTTFQPGTDTKTNVLFFQKANGEIASRKVDDIFVAVPLHCGHDRRGRTHYSDGRPYSDDFASLGKPEKRKGSLWVKVKLTEPDYLVPRYYVGGTRTTDEESLTNGAKVMSLAEMKRLGYLTIRKGHEVGSDAYGTGDIPFIRTSDVTNFEVSVDPTKAVSTAIYEEYVGQQKLKPGDVLMVVDGRYRIGATALLTESNYRCIVQSHCRIISLQDSSPIDPYELMFALNLPSVKLRIRNLVFVQSTLGTLGNRLLELEIPLLNGNGPWSDKVKIFKEALKERDQSLSQLRQLAAPDPEL